MLIGLSAKKQCGKNTVCTIIQAISLYCKLNYSTELHDFVKHYLHDPDFFDIPDIDDINYIWYESSFAFCLRVCLYSITNDKRIFASDDKTKNELSTIKDAQGNYYTIRQLLQKFGTEVGRSISPNLWVDCFINNYKTELEEGLTKNWIVTDVRFENEANAIRENGGILIRINRNTGLNDTHISETALDDYKDFDLVIDNNGTLDELIDKVYNFMKEFKLI